MGFTKQHRKLPITSRMCFMRVNLISGLRKISPGLLREMYKVPIHDGAITLVKNVSEITEENFVTNLTTVLGPPSSLNIAFTR